MYHLPTKNKEEDKIFKEKLNQSYNICLDELKEPHKNWEDMINQTKFTIDPTTRLPMTSHTFVLNNYDNIVVTNNKHTYVFKRSKFYEKFANPRSRIAKDLKQYYKQYDYVVSLFKHNNKWCLKLSWNSDELM